jgi:hypothetical protein
MSLAVLRDQLVFARAYTTELLDSVPPADWFRQPPGGVSHIAWQVGHLASAEYWLALERLRGPRPEDAALISESFLAQFGRTSLPNPDPARNPSVAEIRAVFDRVHRQTLDELSHITDADLDAVMLKPHRVCKTKRESLAWCAAHEMMHAGQIGLLRRLLGHAPLW